MSSLNSFDFTGRLGGDPRLGTTGNGTDVCNFSCAIDTFGDRPTLWVDVAVWGAAAGPCGRYLSKGSEVAIHGSIDEVASFEKRDGSTGFSLKVSTRDVSFIGGKQDSDSAGSDVRQPVASGGAASGPADDDIPLTCSAI